MGHGPAGGRAFGLLTAFVAVSVIAGTLMTAFVLPVVASAGWAVNAGVDYFDSLPDVLDSTPLPQRSVMLAANGAPIAYFFDENRAVVPLARIAPVLQQAVIAIEDSRFYRHGGVDLKGVARAAINDSAGGTVQGASTLTQQYVKNVMVEHALAMGNAAAAREAVARSATRKVREMRLAISLEDRLTKPQILENYLNIAYFGGDTYGVEAAAERYFGVSAAAVTLPQAATLAGMIQEPGTYDPTRHPAAATRRRDVVLARMLSQGLISTADRDRAVAVQLSARGRPPAHGCTATGAAGYFCDYVLRTLVQDTTFTDLGRTQAARRAAVNRAGLVIRTTLDDAAQYAADDAVRSHVPPTDPSGLGTAAVTVEPGSGRVLAMAQNRTYAVDAGPGRTSVNYSVDSDVGGATGFQTGSSFKPFTLATWLNSGRSLSDTVDATQRPFARQDFTSCGRHLRGTQAYTPGNSEGAETGTMSVLQATFNSVNVAYVDMESQLDLCDLTAIAGRLGVHLAVPGRECGEDRPTTKLPTCVPSLTLGVKEIAPLTMAAAYAGFASGGIYCRPTAVVSIQRAGPTPDSWATVATPGPQCSRALTPEVAHGVTSALTHVLTEGTAAGVGPLSPWPSAGKTGTTDGPYDSWFVGYTAQRSTAVWVADPGRGAGGHERQRLRDITVNGQYYGTVYGASIAAPIWKAIMDRAMSRLPARDWP
ncbi:MAG TPA: transglycosylase domain-containing protein [Kineosporiaceae bacterium]